jgi:cysteine desulfurase family protein (TIGR01976 family)
MTIDVASVRAQFPALGAAGGTHIHFDSPAGTQVPVSVADRMRDVLLRANANLGGCFETSIVAGAIVAEARTAIADFLNAPAADEIVFGQNMTSIAFHVARSLGRLFEPGDEIILTRIEHDANVAPWLALARDHGLVVRWIDLDPERHELKLEELPELLTSRTRLVCVGYASNVLGTVTNVRAVAELAREAGALVFVDAVHYAPHGLIDVQALGCDMLACSPYKFFGPHQGALWARRSLLERMEPYKVRPAPPAPPDRFELGTQSHEGLAGVTAAVDYLATLGADAGAARRTRLEAAMGAVRAYEVGLTEHLVDGLARLPGLRIHGIADRERFERRVPTVSFTLAGRSPEQLARALGERGVFTWHGHSYALEPIRALGLLESGGVLRVGLVHYNTHEEIERFLGILRALA